MLNQFKKTIFNLVFLSLLLIPSVIFAGKFNTDQSLNVYPENEVLNFQTTVNQSQTLTFSIQNTANQDKRIEIAQYPSNGFEYKGNTITNISANSSNYLSIQFEQSKVGDYTSQIKLRHPDTNETKTIQLKATVVSSTQSSGISLSHSSINFGAKPVNSTSTFDLEITNNNNYAINLSAASLKAPFKVKSIPSKVESFTTETITIEYKPTTDSNFEQTLSLNTSDRVKQTINLSVIGKTDGFEETKTSNNNKLGSLEFTTQSLVFSQIEKGESQSQKIKITNPNNFSVDVKVEPKPNKPFQVDLLSSVNQKATIPANSSKVLNITYQPTKNQTYTDTFGITTSLKNNPSYTFQIKGSNLRLSNSTSTRPFPTNNNSENTKFQITRNSINPDLNEIVYFNFNLGEEFESTGNSAALSIKNPQTKQTIYSQRLTNLNNGGNNWKLQWDGNNYQKETMLEGNYTYEVTLSSPNKRQKYFSGTIQIARLDNHTPNPITTTNNNNQTTTQYQNYKCLNYTDISKNSNLCSAILFANQQDLLDPTATYFNQYQKINRQEALITIMNLLDLTPEQIKLEQTNSSTQKNSKSDKTEDTSKHSDLDFSDIDTESELYPYIQILNQIDTDRMVVQGFTEGEETFFKPNQNISRAEMYKLLFELATIADAKFNNNSINFEIDYYLTEQPFCDTKIGSEYDWFTPYAGLANKEFNGTNFARTYFDHFILSDNNQKFRPKTEVNKKELYEFLYETKKLRLVNYK